MSKPIEESRQIIKVSRTIGDDGEHLNAVASDPYGNIPAWRHAFIIMARCVSRIFYPEMTAEEQDFNANILLRQAAMSMKIDKIAREAVEPMKHHPGAAPISDDVLQDDRAVQVLSVWVIPAEECQDCIEHESRTQISGDTSVVSTDEMGDLLSQVAFQHAFFESKGDQAEHDRIIIRIQTDFMKRFDLGKTKH